LKKSLENVWWGGATAPDTYNAEGVRFFNRAVCGAGEGRGWCRRASECGPEADEAPIQELTGEVGVTVQRLVSGV
jgi:hypothetical protein